MKKTILVVILLFCILLGIITCSRVGVDDEKITFCVNGQKIYSCLIPRESSVLRLSATQFRVKIPRDSAIALSDRTLECDLKAGDNQQIFWGGREIACVRRRGSPSEFTQTAARYFPPEYVSVFFEDEEHANDAVKKYQWNIISDFSMPTCKGKASSFECLLASVSASEKANEFILKERRSSVFEAPTGQFYIKRDGEKMLLPKNVALSVFRQIGSPCSDDEGKIQIPRIGTWFEL
ncbi:MAG: hypothetical protein K6B46_01905 [Opitutales bacterium]|nr:hypothetical protein [Opitutales bacterium]